MMASGEPEDLDVDALRLAALATFKKRSELGAQLGKDEEDLDQLRKVALQSKKGPEAAQDFPNPRRHTRHRNFHFRGGFLRDNAYERNSNLIVIKTIPLEELSQDSKPLLLKPQDRFCHLTDEDASSSPKPPKWKATGKFSRFESSSSDSEDSDDYDFTENRTDSPSSEDIGKDTDKDENNSSSQCSEDELQLFDESCDQFVNNSDNDAQPTSCTEVNGVKTNDNIPRIEINGQCSTNGESEITESHDKDSSSKGPNVASSTRHNGSKTERRRRSQETRHNLRHKDGELGSLSDNSRSRRDVKDSKGKDRRRKDLRLERRARRRDDPKSMLDVIKVDPEKLEARRRKFFESKTTLSTPADGKISLRGIVTKSKRDLANSKKPRGHDSTALPRTSVRSTVSVSAESGGKENSKKSERSKKESDEQDLRLLLQKQKVQTSLSGRVKKRRAKSRSRNPIIKSVLSVVKMDGKSSATTIASSIYLSEDHSTTSEEMDITPEPSKSKHHKVSSDTSSTKQSARNSGSGKKRRVTVLDDEESKGECCERLNIIIQKETQPEVATNKCKVPIHLRLGVQIPSPIASQTSEDNHSPSRAVNLKSHPREESPEVPSGTARPVRATINNTNSNPLDVPSSSTSTALSCGQQSQASSAASGIECESELDAKIRKIQERNEAILRRQEEVVADKLLYG